MPIKKFFPATSSFMSRVEAAKGRVMVHCISGVSRSVTLVVAHLMVAHNQNLKRAYYHVRACRPFIGPNVGFKLALVILEVRALVLVVVVMSRRLVMSKRLVDPEVVVMSRRRVA